MPDLENKKRNPITQCSPAVICNKLGPAVHSIILLTASVFVRPTNNRTYKCTYEIETTAHADRGRARTTHVEARTARCWACSSFSRAVALRLSQQIVRLRLGSSSCCPVISPPPVSGLHYTIIGAASTVISHQRHHDIFFSVSLSSSTLAACHLLSRPLSSFSTGRKSTCPAGFQQVKKKTKQKGFWSRLIPAGRTGL